MKDLRDWYKYLEVIAREPGRVSPARTPPSPPLSNGSAFRAEPLSAAPATAVPSAPPRRGNPPRRTRTSRPVLKQETLPIDLGSTVSARRKGGRRPLTETREEIIHRLMDPVLTLHEAAAILNLSKATVRRYTEQGKLACQRTAGGQRRFRLSDVMALLEISPWSTVSAESSGSPPLPTARMRSHRSAKSEKY